MLQKFLWRDKCGKCYKLLNFYLYGRKLRQNHWRIASSNCAKFAPIILLGKNFYFFSWHLGVKKASNRFCKASKSDTSAQHGRIRATWFQSKNPSGSSHCYVVVSDKLVNLRMMMTSINHDNLWYFKLGWYGCEIFFEWGPPVKPSPLLL